jgi:DNA-binding beta-propeller fold protein YncE
MDMNHYQEGNCVKRVGNLLCAVTLVLSVLCLLCIIPDKLDAQQLGVFITFKDNITSDEEGSKLIFPSFVLSEPFTNEIFLIDGKARIIIFTSDFFPLYTLSKNNGIETPHGLTVDADGNLYVAQSATDDNPRHRISVFSACLQWERNIYFEGFEGAESFVPHRIAVDKKGNLYVAASHFPGVLFVDGKGRLIDMISPEEEGGKSKIIDVTLDKAGRIYLVSEEEGRIYIYDKDRNFILKFGEKGGGSGKLSRPRAVGVDSSNGRMYVVDYMRHAINVYNKNGEYMFEFGGMGWGEGWFQYPNDIDVDNEGRILVADLFNQRVQVFNSR